MAKKKDTTPKIDAGVSQEPEQELSEPIETQPMTDADNPKRGSALDEIAASRRAQIEEELNEDRAEDDPERVQLRAPEDEPAPESEPEPESEHGPEPEPTMPTEPMVRVSIDGETREVPASAVTAATKVNGSDREIDGQELISGFQMAAAGQERLRLANQRLQEAQRLETQSKVIPQPDSITPAVELDGNTPAPSPGDISEEDALAMARKLQFGDETEVAEVIRQLQQSPAQGRGEPATPQMLEEMAARSSAMTVESIQYQKDLDTIGTENPGLFTDPILVRVAADFVHQIRSHDLVEAGYDLKGTTREQWVAAYRAEQQQGTPGFRSNMELFRLSAEATQTWKDSLHGAPGDPGKQPSDTAFAGKRQAKRTAGTPPKPATAFASRAPQAAPKTRSSVVDGMRKARGQPVA